MATPTSLRQEPAHEHGIVASLRTVERSVRELRHDLLLEAKATLRFETPPGRQLQIDFGTAAIEIGAVTERVHLFVATLGCSRRCFVAPFRHERQTAWRDGLEGSFRHFGGVPEEVLLDNPKALVVRHDVQNRAVLFHERLRAFARYGGCRPRACAPCRARTIDAASVDPFRVADRWRAGAIEGGKDESGVGYVKRNAVAGRCFACWAELEAHLGWWMRKVADRRVHGTTGEPPIVRFAREEAAALQPLARWPAAVPPGTRADPPRASGCLRRALDTNADSVPWRLIGAWVTLQVSSGTVRAFHAGAEVARHEERRGRRERVIDPRHLAGIIQHLPGRQAVPATPVVPPPETLLRPLAEYERVAGGGW